MITGIEVFAHHGVLDVERRDGQVFVIDLDLAFDASVAAATDDLSATVDYATLVPQVVTAVEDNPVDLIETLAERVAGVCLTHPPVRTASVTVHKPHAPIDATFGDVALTITRSRP